MNFRPIVQFFLFLALILFPLNNFAQTSWHTIDMKLCYWNSTVKEWQNCQTEEAKMTFYFPEDLSVITFIDDEGEIRKFPIEEIEPLDEEQGQIKFKVSGLDGKELDFIVDFDDKYIAILDFSSDNFDEWTYFRFRYEASILYGDYSSDSFKISDWSIEKDKYVDADVVDDKEFLINMDFNNLVIQEKGDESSKITVGIKYSEYDSKNEMALFTSTSSEELKIYVSNNQTLNAGSENISLFIFLDKLNDRYQKLMSFTNLTDIDKPNQNSDEISNEYEKSDQWKGSGSGIIFTTDGYIATNYHVIENANLIEVEFKNRGKIRRYNAEVVKTDPTNDLAIIKINDDSFLELSTLLYNFKSSKSDIGQSVFALGYPKSNIMGTDLKFTDGKISSRTGAMGDVTSYQTTTPIQSGNSGGPLFDTDGNLIAINSSKMVAEDIDNVSYSIKTIYLIPLVDALPENVNLPDSKFLQGKDFTEQFKVLEKYVTLIRVK